MRQLVVNGCSYMAIYARGQGHIELANSLGITNTVSLAKPGSSNTRILRTTLKHSYQNTVPTLYVLGLSFLLRSELPIARTNDPFEGHWVSFQTPHIDSAFADWWTQKDCDDYERIKVKCSFNGHIDKFEDLAYNTMSVVNDLKSRGHQVVVFQQADDIIVHEAKTARLEMLGSCSNIIEGLIWRAVPWQIAQGASTDYDPRIPQDIRHVSAGQHKFLNQFLLDYIRQHDLSMSVL